MVRAAGIFGAALLACACAGHAGGGDARCGRTASDVAVGYWDVGVFGAIAVGVGGWYDPYTSDAWGDGPIDDGSAGDNGGEDPGDPGGADPGDNNGGDDNGGDDNGGDNNGGDNNNGGDTGGDTGGADGPSSLGGRVRPANAVPAPGCFTCTLSCVYPVPIGEANAVTSVGAGESFAVACANAQRQLGGWSRDHHRRLEACRAFGASTDRVPAQPGVRAFPYTHVTFEGPARSR